MKALETTLHNWHLSGCLLFLQEQIGHIKQGLTGYFPSQSTRMSGRILPSTLGRASSSLRP